MSASAPKVNGRAPRVIAPSATPEPRTAGLADALLAFAAEAPKLHRDADGQIQNRTYRYATLDSVLDDVAPLLVKHGLVWTAKAILQDGQPAATYRMTHVASGEIDEWTGPLPCIEPGPQKLGSAMTYMRRYELVAYLNLAPGEDDDGAAASVFTGRAPVDRYEIPPLSDRAHDPAPRPTAAQPTAAPAKPSERPATAKQRTMIEARARAADLTADELANVLLAAAGDETRIWDEGAAERWSQRALDRLPARLVDAVLEQIAQASA